MILKKILGCLLFSLMFCNIANAQIKSVQEAAEKMKKSIVRAKITSKDTLGGYFVNEENNLVEDKSQFVITTNPVTVGMLVKNKAYEKGKYVGKGDYSTYWKNSVKTGNRYTWVFVLDDFKKKCAKKNINLREYETKEHLSNRLCQLLGLDIQEQRDTIVFFNVNKNDLFRPAYNPDITKITTKNVISINALDINTRRWLLDQQFNNHYPWTRMGYTYDWGDSTQNYVGVTEFILKPNSYFQNVKYIVIKDYLK